MQAFLKYSKNEFEKELTNLITVGEGFVNQYHPNTIILSEISELERNHKFWKQEVKDLLKYRFEPVDNEYLIAFISVNINNYVTIANTIVYKENPAVGKLLAFKDMLQREVDILITLKKKLKYIPEMFEFSENSNTPGKESYVNLTRLNELKNIESSIFDLSKLIRICEELNYNWIHENYFSVMALLRTILHHIPPIFEHANFDQVASNYAGGQSFKKAMQHLLNSSKNIADNHLHSQARKNEVLPNDTQANFKNDLDFLLSEIIRKLK